MAIRLTADPQRPRVHTADFAHSAPRRRARHASSTGSVYARYSATVPRAVTIGTPPVHAMVASVAATIAQIDTPGVPCRGLTQCSSAAKGVPPSRARAHNVREPEVMAERPQNHIAIEARPAMAFPTR